MAVTTYDIGSMSPFVLGTHYHQPDFDRFRTWAEGQLQTDAPSLSGLMADRAVAYLICHFIEMKQGKTGYRSETIPDYSYTLAEPFTTTWLKQYEAVIRPKPRQPRRGSVRADRDTSRRFLLIDRAQTRVPDEGRL
jgi:hypothetical protein